ATAIQALSVADGLTGPQRLFRYAVPPTYSRRTKRGRSRLNEARLTNETRTWPIATCFKPWRWCFSWRWHLDATSPCRPRRPRASHSMRFGKGACLKAGGFECGDSVFLAEEAFCYFEPVITRHHSEFDHYNFSV